MKLTGKCKEDFEKWLLLKHIGRDSFVVPRITIGNTMIEFKRFDPSMKYGVYVDYLNTKKFKGKPLFDYVFSVWYDMALGSQTHNKLVALSIYESNKMYNDLQNQ